MRDLDLKILVELKQILPDPEPEPDQNSRAIKSEVTKRRTKK